MNAGNPYSATREKAPKGDVGVTADKTEGEEEGMGEIQSRMWMVGLSTRCNKRGFSGYSFRQLRLCWPGSLQRQYYLDG